MVLQDLLTQIPSLIELRIPAVLGYPSINEVRLLNTLMMMVTTTTTEEKQGPNKRDCSAKCRARYESYKVKLVLKKVKTKLSRLGSF